MEPVTVEALRKMATLQGYAWSDAEIEAILPPVARLLLLVERLETLPLGDIEPAIYYHMF
jgi:hypothetical protein